VLASVVQGDSVNCYSKFEGGDRPATPADPPLFTTNEMCETRNTHMDVAQTSNNFS